MAEQHVSTKTCRICKSDYPTTEFYRAKESKDGLRHMCKACSRATAQAWRVANPERAAGQYKAWRIKNIEHERARDKARASSKKVNKEKSKARSAKWQAANADRRALTNKAWAAANPERRKTTASAWKKANHGLVALYTANRRAKTRASAGRGWTADDVAAVKSAQNAKCALCRVKLGNSFHRDHIIPVKLGGIHDRKNLQLLCAPCNLSKGARHPISHARTLGLLL